MQGGYLLKNSGPVTDFEPALQIEAYYRSLYFLLFRNNKAYFGIMGGFSINSFVEIDI